MPSKNRTASQELIENERTGREYASGSLFSIKREVVFSSRDRLGLLL